MNYKKILLSTSKRIRRTFVFVYVCIFFRNSVVNRVLSLDYFLEFHREAHSDRYFLSIY